MTSREQVDILCKKYVDKYLHSMAGVPTVSDTGIILDLLKRFMAALGLGKEFDSFLLSTPKFKIVVENDFKNFWARKKDSLLYCSGSFLCSYIAMWDVFKEFGISFDEKTTTILEVFKEFLSKGIFYCSFDPKTNTFSVLRNCDYVVVENGQYHNPNGPAMGWGHPENSSGLFFLRGFLVSESVINKTITVTDIMNISNIEKRMVVIDHIGWEVFFKETDAIIIDRDPDPEIGTLWSINLPGSEGEKLLEVLCATGRKFYILVDKSIKTALDAQNWVWGFDNFDFVKPTRT